MREAGRIIVIDPGADRPLAEHGTAQCVHCGGHFPIQPGSGKVRGFCCNCNGPICGPKCLMCVPAEQQLENMEAGLPIDHRPIRIATRG
jgi:hypothetical protein